MRGTGRRFAGRLQTRAGKKISSNPGGFCQARQDLPKEVVIDVSEHVPQQLRGQMGEGWPGLQRPIFMIDGTSLQLAHEADLVEAFPPGRNQHGEHHWPVLKVAVFHDVQSGLALQPTWGPMFGEKAVSEQALAKEGLSRVPADGVVLTDCNFGIFDFACAVRSSGRGLIARLTKERALRILGRRPVGEAAEVAVVWEPSQHDRRAHPDLPEGARLSGRVIVFRHRSRASELIYLFTTLDLAAGEVKEIYKLRWNVETDLRSLKRTAAIHKLSGQSVDMVEKELMVAVTAYNMVRAVMCVAARRAGMQPRELSFSGALAVVQEGLPGLAQADGEVDREERLERMLNNAARLKIPKRSQQRSCPREVWGQGGKFPPRKRAAAEGDAK